MLDVRRFLLVFVDVVHIPVKSEGEDKSLKRRKARVIIWFLILIFSKIYLLIILLLKTSSFEIKSCKHCVKIIFHDAIELVRK